MCQTTTRFDARTSVRTSCPHKSPFRLGITRSKVILVKRANGFIPNRCHSQQPFGSESSTGLPYLAYGTARRAETLKTSQVLVYGGTSELKGFSWYSPHNGTTETPNQEAGRITVRVKKANSPRISTTFTTSINASCWSVPRCVLLR